MTSILPVHEYFLGNASYNSLIEQVAFCKLQGFDTVSRSTSMGPRMFVDGRIQFGVGLSDVQFEGRTSQCGRCINVTRIDNFFPFNHELTLWNESASIRTPFTVFVMDQCTDEVCKSGYLDFDIYSPTQPVMYGNPYDLQWEYVDCPVEEDVMDILFCLGPNSCNVQDREGRLVEEMMRDAVAYGYWFMYPRNTRVPITDITVHIGNHTYDLTDDSGWRWTNWEGREDLGKTAWTFTARTMDGISRVFTVDWTEERMQQRTTLGYRGGVVMETDTQV